MKRHVLALIFLLLVLFLLIGIISFLLKNSFQKKEILTSNNNSQAEGREAKSKYTRTYSEQAKKEGRVLNDEERYEYMWVYVPSSSILGRYIREEIFSCVIDDFGIDKKRLKLYSKEGKIRLEIVDPSNNKLVRLAIETMGDIWTMDMADESQNFHVKMKTKFQPIMALEFALMGEGGKEEIFKKNCKSENNFPESLFVAPSGSIFIEK